MLSRKTGAAIPRGLVLALFLGASVARGFTTTPASAPSAAASLLVTSGGRSSKKNGPLCLSGETAGADADAGAPDPKTKLATDLARLFDINEMAYTVMIKEETKGADGKLTPDELVAAIQKDDMFGEEFEEYCKDFATEDEDVKILDIGKFSEDMQSSEALQDDANLTIPGKGNYLVHLSFAEGILATMRVVVP